VNNTHHFEVISEGGHRTTFEGDEGTAAALMKALDQGGRYFTMHGPAETFTLALNHVLTIRVTRLPT
jgi:hypothetical protein